MFQSDLFERPVVPGLRFQPDMVTPDVERDLIARIDTVDLAPFRFQQLSWRCLFGGKAQREALPEAIQGAVSAGFTILMHYD